MPTRSHGNNPIPHENYERNERVSVTSDGKSWKQSLHPEQAENYDIRASSSRNNAIFALRNGKCRRMLIRLCPNSSLSTWTRQANHISLSTQTQLPIISPICRISKLPSATENNYFYCSTSKIIGALELTCHFYASN